MKDIHKTTNIALIFMLIGVFLCQDIAYASDISCLRVPVNIDEKRKEEAAGKIRKKKTMRYRGVSRKEKRESLIKEINKAREELKIKKGEEVDVGVLATKMGYANQDSFTNSANRLGLNVAKLRAMSIKGITARPSREQKRELFIDKLNEAMKKLTIKEDKVITVKELSREMGYATKYSFIIRVTQLGLKGRLRAMGIKEIDVASKKKLSRKEKRESLIKEINKAKKELGIKKGEEVDVEVLAIKMGSDTKEDFMRAAAKVGLRVLELRAMGIKGMGEPRSMVRSIKELDAFIIAKDKLGLIKNLDNKIPDIIEEVRSVLLDMDQGEAIYYYTADDIQRNINEVSKGIFEKVMSDINPEILYNAANCLVDESAEGQLKKIAFIIQHMEEARDRIQNYIILKLEGDELISAIVGMPDYKFVGIDREVQSDRDKIKHDIKARGSAFLERIDGYIKIEAKSLSDRVDSLNKKMEVVLGVTFGEIKEIRNIEFSNGLLELERFGESETVFPATLFLNKDEPRPVTISMPRKNNPVKSLGIPGLIEILDAFVFDALRRRVDLSEAVIMKIEDFKDEGGIKIIIKQDSSAKEVRDKLTVHKKKFNLEGPTYLMKLKKRTKSPAFRSGLEYMGKLMDERPVHLIYKIGMEDPFPIEVNLYVSREATSFLGLDEIVDQIPAKPTDL